MTTTRQNTIAFCVGPKGSGKSYALDRYFTRSAPRVIHLDFVGEVDEKYPGVDEAVGFRATILRLQEYANAGLVRWRLVAVFPESHRDDLPRLFTALCPEYRGRLGAPGLSRAFGGIAVECAECDVILPNNASADARAARTMLKRGRHEALSLFLATQRPQECSRLCTAMADYTVAFRMQEPRELQYFADGIGSAFARRVQHLKQYHSLWYHRPTGRVLERDADGQEVTP